ncbi:unnamed protein product [Effrenium voratum]|uniref:Pentatricopeptide repeat-containing protein, chloroplastic n=1 Tax=Effrenium voratum TaxID=2562239 RepID=A0AA36J9X3_9DINO|nr:unnamed protein product [Effrenium voratum]CAJ1447330.1 unnamed protein product [Effrenium voratum]
MGEAKATAVAFGRAIGANAREAQWREALELLTRAEALELQVNLISYNAAANACEKAERWPEVLDLVGGLNDKSLQGDRFSLSSLLSALSAGHHWQAATRALSDRSFQPDAVAYNAALGGCSTASGWAPGLELLEGLRQEGLQCNIFLLNSCLALRSSWARAVALLRLGARWALEPTLVTRSAAMAAAFERWPLALGQLSSLSSHRPNLVIFKTVLGSCAAGGWQPALALLFQAAPRHLRSLPSRSCSEALGACARHGEWQQALAALRALEELQVELNVVSYTSAISACAGQWEQALLAFEHLRSSIQASVVSYNSAISSCGPFGHWHRACQLLGDLQMARLAADEVSYGAAVHACEVAGDWESALHLCCQLASRMGPEAVSWSAGISACGACLQWQHALALFGQLTEELGEDAIARNAAISACGESGQWQRALSLLRAAPGPGTVTFTAAICACGARWEHGLALLRDMQELQLESNLFSFNAAMGACQAAEQWPAALALLEELAERFGGGDMISHCAVLGACGERQTQRLPLLRGLRQRLLLSLREVVARETRLP